MKNRNHSLIFGIIHWAIAICIIIILITIFLRLNWMNKNHLAGIIQNYLSTTNQSLTQDQLIQLAKQIRKPMWNWHIYIGYVLVGLFSIRFFLPLFGTMKFKNPFNKELNFKEKFRFWIYIVFYIGIILSLTTGMIIELGPKDLKKPIESIHVLSNYYLIAFIILHLVGLLLSKLSTKKRSIPEK